MPFAVVETGGKQHVVREGETLAVEKLPKPDKGNTITFDKVLVLDDGEKTQIGDPYLKGAEVKCEYIEEGRAKKITVFKYKSKTRQRTKKGHRQPYTRVRVSSFK